MEGPLCGRRISVCGTSGSGKSTLAAELAAILGVPHIELDGIHHMENWQERPVESFRGLVDEATRGEGWVVDGNYRKVRDIVWGRADTVVWLDYRLPVILWRLTRRIVRRGLLREELWNGNRESLWRHFFTRESLYLWVLQTYRRRRLDFRQFQGDPEWGHLRFVHLRSPQEARVWLERVCCSSKKVIDVASG